MTLCIGNGVDFKSSSPQQLKEFWKYWSLGQILEKRCVRSRGHIFSQLTMKLGQNVCLDEISDEFEYGSCWVKN